MPVKGALDVRSSQQGQGHTRRLKFQLKESVGPPLIDVLHAGTPFNKLVCGTDVSSKLEEDDQVSENNDVMGVSEDSLTYEEGFFFFWKSALLAQTAIGVSKMTSSDIVSVHSHQHPWLVVPVDPVHSSNNLMKSLLLECFDVSFNYKIFVQDNLLSLISLP